MFLNLDLHPRDALAAMDDSGTQVTYGQLVDECRSLAAYLPPRELIFCLCRNTIGSLEGYISFYENRDVSLLLASTMDSERLQELMSIYQPAYLWVPTAMVGLFTGETVTEQRDYSLIKTGYISCPMADELSLLLTTSGSTGSPKLVRHKYGNVEANARNVAKVFGWTPEEHTICSLAMNYTMGLNVLSSSLYAGARLLLAAKDLMHPDFWKFIAQEGGTNFTGVPYSYEIMTRLRFKKMNLPHLRMLAEGGGKLPDNVFMEYAQFAHDTARRFCATFGTTETTARIAFLPPELAIEKCGSIGRAIPEGELFLIDTDGSEIETPEAEGELAYHGPNVTMGYAICAKDLMKGDEFNGRYETGDIARRDGDGCYYIIGRKKRFLKLFGFRVSLDQSERLIAEHFGIECACTGTDECMEIFITNETLVSDVRKYMSMTTHLPEHSFNMNVVREIPRSDSGKIQYMNFSIRDD